MTDEHDNTLFIELSIDGSYWNVNSGGIFRKGYSDKKETVVKTEPQQPNNAASTSSSLSVDEVEGIATTEPNGEPTVSASKDTQSVSTVQTDRKEISEKSAESNVEVTNEEVASLPKNEGEQALFSLSAEEQSIIDTAKSNGTHMQAPNGQPTKLTEKQWAQVRTKAFKEWFGDWEKAANIKSGINALLRIANGEESVPKAARRNELSNLGGTAEISADP